MTLDSFSLIRQLGAGADGIAYLAREPSHGRSVEVRVLEAARARPERWDTVRKRIRIASLLVSPATSHQIAFLEDETPRYLVLEWVDTRSVSEHYADRVPLGAIEAIATCESLASSLAEAHHMGLSHGAIHRDTVRCTGSGHPRLDFTGLDVGEGTPPDSTPYADVEGLGRLLHWLLAGLDGSAQGEVPTPITAETCDLGSSEEYASLDAVTSLDGLVRDMLARDEDLRPTARQVADRLREIGETLAPASHAETIASVAPSNLLSIEGTSSAGLEGSAGRQARSTGKLKGRNATPVADPQVLGRYRLHEKLGQGGMGTVYRGEDLVDGTVVAVKVLRAEWAAKPGALRRFQKEARLLGEVNNPFVTNLLEVNEDDDIHYLVLEYVAGTNLGKVLMETPILPEQQALSIMGDVARALVEAHDRGIVHRDIKPDNILLSDPNASGMRRVKLSDFGLARHVVESESLQLTMAQAVVGTPQYMAPEQGTGGTIDPRTDVYAMGTTLFRMITGQVPFSAPTLSQLIAQHCNDPPPSVHKLNPGASDGVARIIEKALSKSPDFRFTDASAILVEIDRLLKGEPTAGGMHPKLPESEPGDLLKFDFTWDLEASPRQLWPLVTNTERLNHAIGLPAVTFRDEPDPVTGRMRRFGSAKQGGILAEWEEHPFEWIEPRRMGVLREYQRGPFRWMTSSLELTPKLRGGTTLTHRIKILPRGALMRAAASLKIGRDTKRALERVYRRLDASLMGKLENAGLTDPFEDPAPLSHARRRRLERLLEGLSRSGVHQSVVARLGEFLASAPAQEVTRIRPLALARRLGLDASQVVSACLHGARDGLFVLLWDILCPLCRVPSEVKDTLRQLRDHGHCEACGLDYELDFAKSVEMIFRVHPEVREADLGVYCIGGPAHSPHVVAQVRVAPGERLELDLGLSEGQYQVRGPQLPFAHEFRVEPSSGPRRLEIDLRMGASTEAPRVLRAGNHTLAFRNDFDQELVVRVERTASRNDALTAARASSLALFRELFPGEILSAGQLISIATTTLLLTSLADADVLYAEKGDAGAFAVIHEHMRLLEEAIRREGGALVKTVGEGVLAAFSETASAVRVGLGLPEILSQGELTGSMKTRACVHRGPAMAATINDHLDYFGLTVAQVSAMLHSAEAGDLLLSQAVAADPSVIAALRARARDAVILTIPLPGLPTALVHRLRSS